MKMTRDRYTVDGAAGAVAEEPNRKRTVITSFGPHLILDLSACNPDKLDDLDHCFNILNELPDEIGMTKITQPHVFRYSGLVPEDEGITGVVIIAESHISLHTFPRKNYAFVDVFSCKHFDVDHAKRYIIDAFESEDPEVFVTERGAKFPRYVR